MKRQKKKLKISTAIASKMLSISAPNFSPDPIETLGSWPKRGPRKMMKISHMSLVRSFSFKLFLETDYNQAELDKIDMQSLNLFGVPLDEGIGSDQLKDIAGTNKETQKVLRDLIDITEELAGDTLSNFSLRKSFVYYDPYEPDQSIAQTYLKFEDS